MTDLLEDRLRRSLSAVADSTPIPMVPEPGSLAVVRPIRRRVIVGTTGVGIAAAVTSLAVVAATAGGTTESVKRPAIAVRPGAATPSPAGCVNQPYVDPVEHSDLLYLPTVLPPKHHLHVSWVRTECSDSGTDYPLLALAAWSADHTKITQDVAVYGPSAQVGSTFLPSDIKAWQIQPATVGGLPAKIADQEYGRSVVWWTTPDGGHWAVAAEGVPDGQLETLAGKVVVSGTSAATAHASIPASSASGWADITPPQGTPGHAETHFDAYYTDQNVQYPADDFWVSISEGDAGPYVSGSFSTLISDTTYGTWAGHPAAWSAKDYSFSFELRPGTWVYLGGGALIDAGGQALARSVAASLRHVTTVPGITSAEPPSPSYSPSPPDPNAPSSPPIPSFTPPPTAFPPRPSATP